jgi:GDSL-like Lipase/Acylhydrolase family
LDEDRQTGGPRKRWSGEPDSGSDAWVLSQSRNRRRGWRRFAKNVALASFSVGFTLLLLEGALRVYSAIANPKMMSLDDRLGWRHTPGVRKTFVNELEERALVVENENGHRALPVDRAAGSGAVRILTLGDSFTEGSTVGETEVFTARMQQADPRLEVLNAGVGGYGTVQELLYLTSEGMRFKPDLVLLLFYENDLTDNTLSYYATFGPRPYATLDGTTVRIIDRLDPSRFEAFILPLPFRSFLNRHSYLYYYLNTRVYQRLAAARMEALQTADMNRTPPPARMQILFGILARIKEALDQQHVPLVVVHIPSRDEVARGASENGLAITDHCRQVGMNCLSLTDRFVGEKAAGKQLYFPIDIHWTRTGHAVAAEEILAYLRAHPELLPRLAPPAGQPSPR